MRHLVQIAIAVGALLRVASAPAAPDQPGSPMAPPLVIEPPGGQHPTGPPCDGLAVSIRLNTDPQSPYARAVPVDLYVTNLSRVPKTVMVGGLGEFAPAVLVFDQDGRALSPPELGPRVMGIGGCVFGSSSPVDLKPGESVLCWQSELYTPCDRIGLPPGTYTAEVVAFRRQDAAPQKFPGLLISNLLPFNWPGPAKQ
jgi:hypothetical protein